MAALLPRFYAPIAGLRIDSRAGDILALFAAGIALLVLFVASYGGRRAWIACGSTVMSLAVLAGFMVLSTSKDPGFVQASVAWAGNQLAPMLDRQTLDVLRASIEDIAKAPSRGNDAARRAAPPPPPAGGQAMQAASTPGWFGKTNEPKAEAGSPVTWLLDEANGQVSSSPAGGFLIGGVNVSDQALQDVRATLKTESGQVELALSVDGSPSDGDAVIPARARFSLTAASLGADGSDPVSGGGILTFRYSAAGQQKATILPLTGSTVAPSANSR